jgi:hypothetical protein
MATGGGTGLGRSASSEGKCEAEHLASGMGPVFPTLQMPCLGYETVFLYRMLFGCSSGCDWFIRILMGQYLVTHQDADN